MSLSRLSRLLCHVSLAGAIAAALPLPALAQGKRAEVWVTSADGRDLLAHKGTLPRHKEGHYPGTIRIDPSRSYQEIVGFGAALTDGSAEMIQHGLDAAGRAALLQELFGADGLALGFTRLTIGASDFSSTHYTFDDQPKGGSDPELKGFSIDPNRDAVLPVIKQIRAVNPDIAIMASPWSAPGWMKTTDSLIKGKLRPDYYDVFARYMVAYTKAYAAEGVPLYALTLQNEPHFEPEDYPGMKLTPDARARVVADHLGPMLAQMPNAPRILEWDHNWDEPDSPIAMLADKKAAAYVSGVAWHCYAGDVAVQSDVHEAYPDKDAYITECSGGGWAPEWDKTLAWMMRNLIIDGTRHWARGVLLWNLALNEKWGPHLGGCGDCRGVVTIDSQTGAITRNLEYYVLGHASRFVRRGAVRVESGASGVNGVHQVAFRNKDGSFALIALNQSATAQPVTVAEGGESFTYSLPAGAVATFTWNDAAK